MVARTAVAIATCLTMTAACAARPAAAQGGTTPESTVGRVRPDQPPNLVLVPPALRAGVAENLRRLVAAIKHNPTFEPPLGFDIVFVPYARHFPDSASAPIKYQSYGMFYSMYRDRAGVIKAGVQGEFGYWFYANDIEPVFGEFQTWEKDERGTQLYLGPVQAGTAGGYPHYGSSGVVVLTRITRPLWVPVTRERAIAVLLRDARAGLNSARQTAAELRTPADSGLQDWLRHRAEREREVRRSYDEMKKDFPEQAERMLANFRTSEAETEKMLRAVAAQQPVVDRSTDHRVRSDEACVRLLEEHLASLSPHERSAPASVLLTPETKELAEERARWHGCPHIADAPSRYTRAIVEANPDFFDRALPGSAIQLIIVNTDFQHELRLDISPYFKRVVFPRIKAGVDWPALAALLSGR